MSSQTRFVYLRSSQKDNQYPQKDMPVGCIAYQDAGSGSFYYGISFLNPEVNTVDKGLARRVAQGRLDLAQARKKRLNQQGRWGYALVKGESLNQKVAALLDEIRSRGLHRNPEVRERVRSQLRDLAYRLCLKDDEAA